MKKIALYCLLLAVCFTVSAQHKGPGKPPHHPVQEDIVNMVSDLSPLQKKRLESLSNESKKRMDNLRRQQGNVRDSIRTLLDQNADNSAALFPLFDREAFLQAEVSKECYRTRVKINAILTSAQSAELHEKMNRHHKGDVRKVKGSKQHK